MTKPLHKPSLSLSCSELVGIKNKSYYFSFLSSKMWFITDCGNWGLSRNTLVCRFGRGALVSSDSAWCCPHSWRVFLKSAKNKPGKSKHTSKTQAHEEPENGWGGDLNFESPNKTSHKWLLLSPTLVRILADCTSQMEMGLSYKFPAHVAPVWVRTSAESGRGHTPVLVALL